MNIGCCENCRYLDLMDDAQKKCPRCGASFVSLGIGSAQWNRMSEEERDKILASRFAKPDPELWSELWPEPEPGTEAEQAGEYQKEYVFVCYKCNTVAAHSEADRRYYCGECGSDMVPSGYDTVEWAYLSKEEKRKVTEEAKIHHMVSEIKKFSYDDEESTPRVIRVVKDKVY
ncbi:MAG: hypothetical protein J5367_07175 [Lachnospiraceae bacterium]|nr:hypothetical protein [Lachnospiraceae bacterium]